MKELNCLTVEEASALLAAGEITSQELTAACLTAAQRHTDLNAFITLLDGQDNRPTALTAAITSDERRRAGKALSPLDGIPYVIKDSFCTKGVRTTAGSLMLDNFVPPYSATVVEKLDGAGAVMLGKSNMDQFGHGSSTENSAFGPTKNPWDQKRVPGGSSGGSAAALAADLTIFAIGEDTGGSIRQPASFTNTVGLKVTYGRVSRYGSVAYASSLDTMGPMTKTVLDAALVLQAIAGHDKQDATSSVEPVPDYLAAAATPHTGITIGLPRELFGEGVEPRVAAAVRQAAAKLEQAGHSVRELSIPILAAGISLYYIIAWAETSSNLARYDGIHFGNSTIADGDQSLFNVYADSRARGFSEETKRRLMLGTYVLSAGYYDAYYRRAQRARTTLIEGFNRAWQEVDLLLAPVSPTPPFTFGAKSDPVAMYMADILTTPVNPAGVPALALPAGFVEEEGRPLPVGMQLIGPQFSEPLLLAVGQQWQVLDDSHTRKPTLL